MLFGSRGRGTAHSGSDWDFGYLGGGDTDPLHIAAALGDLVGDAHIDAADLSRASGVLRFHAARDGQIIYAETPRVYEDFWLEAVDFWCDAEPTLRNAYASVLSKVAEPSRASS